MIYNHAIHHILAPGTYWRRNWLVTRFLADWSQGLWQNAKMSISYLLQNKIVGAWKVVWRKCHLFRYSLGTSNWGFSRRELCNYRIIDDEKHVNLESSRITFLRISRELVEKSNSRSWWKVSISRSWWEVSNSRRCCLRMNNSQVILLRELLLR